MTTEQHGFLERFIRFAIAVTIGAGNNGHISPKDAMEMIDYLCGLLAA